MREPMLPLSFPVGIAVDANYLYVADSGHHRILECDHGGRVLRQFASGGPRLIDGSMELSAFHRPPGLCLPRHLPYVPPPASPPLRPIHPHSGPNPPHLPHPPPTLPRPSPSPPPHPPPPRT